MESVYENRGSSKTQRAFSASYPVDINNLVSLVLRNCQDESKKLSYQTAIGSMYINALTKYVVGEGLIPSPSPEKEYLGWSHEKYSRFISQASAFFRLMTGSGFDWYGRYGFQELQQLAFRNILITGDVLMHRCYAKKNEEYRPKLQLISGSWISSPNGIDEKSCIGGVRLNTYGEETGYFIEEVDDSLNATGNYKERRKYNERTNFEEFRLVKLIVNEANQVRGIPLLNTIRNDIIDTQAFTTAHIQKAIMTAVLAAFIKKSQENGGANMYQKVMESAEISARDAGDDRYVERLASALLTPGFMMELNVGEDITTVESKIAGTDYKSFMDSRLDIMGGSVEIPREMALGSYSASFSASRGTIGTAEKAFAIKRANFARSFCQPEYEQIIDYGIRIGAIDCPEYLNADFITKKAILSVSWTGPSAVVIDPTKEVKALSDAVNAMFTTRDQACRQLNSRDFDETVDILKAEKDKIDSLGLSAASDKVNTDNEETDKEEEENNG